MGTKLPTLRQVYFSLYMRAMGRSVSLLLVRPGFNVHVSYVLQKVAVIQVFLRILRVSFVSFHQRPIYYRSHIISVFDSVVK